MSALLKGLICLLAVASFSSSAFAERIDIWGSIPFIRGADLCQYQNAYGQTRNEYMSDMVRHAEDLMSMGAYADEALNLLVAFDSLYDKNRALAVRHKHLDVTLESTLKAYMDKFYRDLRPRVKKLSFRQLGSLENLVDALKKGQRPGNFDDSMMKELDYLAYGSYTLAPDCRGKIQVTISLVGRDGTMESFEATGKPQFVMSDIAAQMFTHFQRTKFPSTLRVGNRNIQLVGALNGSVGVTHDPRLAESACETLGARLPNRNELEMIDAYGDWSGGVSINDVVWAMPYGKVYHPGLRNPSPVRSVSEVNSREFHYYCIK